MSRKSVRVLSSVLGFAALLYGASPAWAQAVVPAPDLGTTSTYGVASDTFVNTAAGTTITGTAGQPVLCHTVAGAPASPATLTGTNPQPCPAQVGLDQTDAIADLNTQTGLGSCTALGAGGLEGISIAGGAAGTFPPGCYFRAGALTITANGVITLNGDGVYIFRSTGGAITTGADVSFNLVGACETDVFWGAAGATTLGADNAFVGNVLDAAGVTIGQNTTWVGRALAFGGTVTVPLTPVDITVPTCAAFAPPVPPTVIKAFSPDTNGPGGTSTLTITLTNTDATAATLTAAFVDTLPAGVVIDPTPNASTTCGGGAVLTATAGGSSVTLSTGSTIPAAGGCIVRVRVTAAAAGTYTNTIAVGALQTSNGNNAVAATDVLTIDAAIPPVPTLSEWVMIALAALLCLSGFFAIRRRRMTD